MTAAVAPASIRAVPRSVAMLLAALLLGVAGQQLFFARAPGLNVLVATLLFLAAALWLRPRPRRSGLADAWLPGAALAFATLCAVRADAALISFDAAAAAGASVAWIAALAGAPISRLDVRGLLLEVADGVIGIVARPARLARRAAGPIALFVRRRTGRLPRYAGGAALASPFLAIFSLLFASADPIYARRVNDLFDIVHWQDVFRDAAPRSILLIVIAWCAAAALSKLDRAWTPEPAAVARGAMHFETVAVVLACVDLLFGAFVALQIGYLFGGRDTLDAAGVPFSAYARRGFFELIGCTALVGALLFGLGIQRTRSIVTTALALLLVGLTMVVLVSAWYRLDLYQLAYGWTELRFYAVAAIVFLGLALVVLGWSVVAGRMRYAVQPLIGLALLVALAVNAVSPAAFVARADLERLIDPSGLPADAERRMDPSYLVSLGDGAFPVLVEMLPSLGWDDRNLLGAWLRWSASRRAAAQRPWESLNLDRARATEALDAVR